MTGKTHRDESVIYRQNISYYDEIADDYDAMLQRDASNKITREKVAEKFTLLVKNGAVLDFGGGTGSDLGWLSAGNYDILFCEPSAGMRGKAILYNKATLHNNHIVFQEDGQADFTSWHHQLPFSQKVDGILSNFAVFNCIPDIGLLFKNLSLVIKPGGHLLALVLDSRIAKVLRWRPKSVFLSFLNGKPMSTVIDYKNHRQKVFIYTAREIKRASQPYFDFCSGETLQGSDFSMIHLTRK